jgi:ABC-type multidrug transport system fused ATPase/permease subunit
LRSPFDAVHVSDFLQSKNDDVDTHNGSPGSGLSGGQWRLRMAFCATPILLLYEATLALDASFKTTVQAALERHSIGGSCYRNGSTIVRWLIQE